MAIRTTRSEVTFRASFLLSEVGEALPAGTYDIETDEEIIETNERTIYRRVATLLRVSSGGIAETFTIKPESLDAAIQSDQG